MRFYQAPDQSLHQIEPEFAHMLPAGSVQISDEQAQAIIAAQTPQTFVPPAVTRFQARAALHLAGLLESVESLMADPNTDPLARIAWQDAQEFRRNSPTVLGMAAALGLTEAGLDALFIQAAGIEA